MVPRDVLKYKQEFMNLALLSYFKISYIYQKIPMLLLPLFKTEIS